MIECSLDYFLKFMVVYYSLFMLLTKYQSQKWDTVFQDNMSIIILPTRAERNLF